MPLKDRDKEKEYQREWYQKNKKRVLEQSKQYKKDNKEIVKERNKLWYIKNSQIISKQKKEYYLNNKPKIMERTLKYEKNRYKTDPIYRLNRCASSSLSRCLKYHNLSKNNNHWENLVGYTVKDLKEHLEGLFLAGMTWNNYGEWHIDHVIPQTFFAYTSTNDVEFKYCWSLDNLQPLWAKDNLSKSNKI